jgi:sugar phosphate isomerase/epimerase
LAEITAVRGVEVWIENHGDFAGSNQTDAILQEAASPRTGVVWDPVNSFVASEERPADAAARLGVAIRHVHIKDLRRDGNGWKYVLPGEGDFPLLELKAALQDLQYDRFVSFEWEKKWHPEIADADVALPHFARWFRTNYA